MAEFIMDAVLGIVLLAFAILGGQIPHLSNPNDVVEASGFPIIFSVVGLILLAVEVISQVRKLKKEKEEGKAPAESKIDAKNFYKVAIVVAMTIAYILISKWIGFFVFSLIFCFVCLYLLGSKNLKFNIIFTILAVLALTLIFGRFFGIILPRGQWFFKEFSYYLY